MIDRRLLEKKKRLQRVRNILKTLTGIRIIEMCGENKINLDRIGYFSNDKVPDSKIDSHSEQADIYRWIINSMQIEEKDIFYLLCEGIWVKIQFENISEAVPSLWNMEKCMGFTIMNEDKNNLMEVGSDSRDEHNYLFDQYFI